MTDEFRVFISAVTSEFGDARDALGADLRGRGADVSTQSDFNPGRRRRDATRAAARLHPRLPSRRLRDRQAKRRLSRLQPRRRHSQRYCRPAYPRRATPNGSSSSPGHYKRRLYTYLASNDYVADEPKPSGADFPACNRPFVEHIKAQNVHWAPFLER
jgi:hypothetical protein